MSRQDESNNNSHLVIILSVLLVLIVGLVILIIVLNNRKPDTTLGEEQLPLDIVAEIDEKFYNYDYSMEDTIERYEKEINSGSKEKRIVLAIDYANFILRNTEDLPRAIVIMEKIKPLMNNKEDELRYYGELSGLCRKAGQEECMNEYKTKAEQIINELGVTE